MLPDKILGDFAFVVWDATKRRLFAARDIGGARPLYYIRESANAFLLASDLRDLVGMMSQRPALDLQSVRLRFELGYGGYCAERTLLRGVRKLPPGHALTFEAHDVRVAPWWSPDRLEDLSQVPLADLLEEARALVREAVACRVRDASGEVGVHVSGGLDCSSLAVFAQRELTASGRSVSAVSWSPPRDVIESHDLPPSTHVDERSLVEAVTNLHRLPLRYTALRIQDVLSVEGRDLTTEPTETLLFELAASREAAGLGFRTMISGWGGDEFIAFNGRGYFADLLRRGRLRQLHNTFHARRQVMGTPVWKQWIASGLLPVLPFDIRNVSYPRRLTLPSALNADFAEAVARAEPLPRPVLRERPGVRRMQLALLRSGHLSQRIESWSSHGAMAGIEYLYPLLDRRVIEFALSAPDHLYMRDGWKRWLYRSITEGILPDEVRWNKRKEDPAASEQVRRVYMAARSELAKQLCERAGHPLVDVHEIARSFASPSLTSNSRRRRWWQQPTDRTDHPESAAWLAFVDPVTGW